MKIRKKLIASAMIVAMMAQQRLHSLVSGSRIQKAGGGKRIMALTRSHSGSGSMAIRMALQNAITLMAAAICFQIPRPRMDM